MNKKELMRKRFNKISYGVEAKPCKERHDIFSNSREKRVAVYIRSGNPPSNCGVSAFEIQEQHYKKMIAEHEQWSLVDIFADYAPANSIRPQLERMLSDCRAGKIDFIITKSISRFMRDLSNLIEILKELAELSPPVGVFFENEQLCSLDTKGINIIEMILDLAKEESRRKSEQLRWVTYYKDLEPV